MDPDGVVAFFPSDHHFADDEAFATHINSAFAQAELHPGRVILLGIAPEAPEDSYGWIEPGAPLGTCKNSVSEVRRFWEKPSRSVAFRLMRRGCLWNSFVVGGRVRPFFRMIPRTLPALPPSLQSTSATPPP